MSNDTDPWGRPWPEGWALPGENDEDRLAEEVGETLDAYLEESEQGGGAAGGPTLRWEFVPDGAGSARLLVRAGPVTLDLGSYDSAGLGRLSRLAGEAARSLAVGGGGDDDLQG